MDIGNDTDSNAKVKVSSGGAGAEAKARRLTFNRVEATVWPLPPGKTVRLPPPDSYPVTLFFQIEEQGGSAGRRGRKREIRHQVKVRTKRLKLTKEPANGFKVKVA